MDCKCLQAVGQFGQQIVQLFAVYEVGTDVIHAGCLLLKPFREVLCTDCFPIARGRCQHIQLLCKYGCCVDSRVYICN